MPAPHAPWPGQDLLPIAGPPVAARRHGLPAAVREHSHAFAEIAVIVAGRGRHLSAAGEHAVCAGAVALLPPGAWHAYRQGRGLEVIDVGIGAEVLRRELAWMARDRELAGIARALSGAGATLVRPSAGGLARLRAALTRLAACPPGAARLGHLLVALATLAPALPTPPAGPPAVEAALRLMSDDLAAPWTLVGLARRLGCDRSRFARAFRAAVGEPPMAWLARCRAARAAELLAAGDQPVAAVGAAVGWPDPVHFARRFRRHHGCSPRAWRRG